MTGVKRIVQFELKAMPILHYESELITPTNLNKMETILIIKHVS